MKRISDSYTIEEVREGFMVPTAIKQAWAAELEILLEIDRICQKYDIQYFADWGTFLGAVRHGGFIPWDDDLDICMKREDYIKFLEVSSKELEDGFFVQTYENMDPDNWLFMGKVVGRNSICFEKEHLRRFHNFPYMACVDIFVLDYVYKDEEKEKKRCELCLFLLALSESIVSDKINIVQIKNSLNHIADKWGLHLKYIADPIEMGRSLYREVERQMGKCDSNDGDMLSQLYPWGLKGTGFRFPKEYYDRAIYLPFEIMNIPVPIAYDKMLRQRYGDYLKIVKSAGAHEYPYFEAQKERFFSTIEYRLPEYTNPYETNNNTEKAKTDNTKIVNTKIDNTKTDNAIIDNTKIDNTKTVNTKIDNTKIVNSDYTEKVIMGDSNEDRINLDEGNSSFVGLNNECSLAVGLDAGNTSSVGLGEECTSSGDSDSGSTSLSAPEQVSSLLAASESGNLSLVVPNTESLSLTASESESSSLTTPDAGSTSLATLVSECLAQLEILSEDLRLLLDKYCDSSTNHIDDEIILNHLLDNIGNQQQLAIDMGNLIESVRGEGTEIVNSIEGFCEMLFELYQSLNDKASGSGIINVAGEIRDFYLRIKEALYKDIVSRENILFMLIHASDLSACLDIFKTYSSDALVDKYNVYIYMQPYYLKEFDGTIDSKPHSEAEEALAFAGWNDDDGNGYTNFVMINQERMSPDFLSLLAPTIIYHTNPYDRWHEGYTVNPAFFSEALKKYTSQLVYICQYLTDNFTKEDGRDYLNMNYYVTRPGVINSDRIIVGSDILCDTYVSKLTEFCGEETIDLWRSRVCSKQKYINQILKLKASDTNVKPSIHELERTDDRPDQGKVKKLLYVSSLGCLMENEERAYTKINECMQIFLKQKDNICVDWLIYPTDIPANPRFEYSDEPEEKDYASAVNLRFEYSDGPEEKDYASAVNPRFTYIDELIEKYCGADTNIRRVDIDRYLSNNLKTLISDNFINEYDAYFGDGSLLVHRFSKMGKPVMIQNYEI